MRPGFYYQENVANPLKRGKLEASGGPLKMCAAWRCVMEENTLYIGQFWTFLVDRLLQSR